MEWVPEHVKWPSACGCRSPGPCWRPSPSACDARDHAALRQSWCSLETITQFRGSAVALNAAAFPPKDSISLPSCEPRHSGLGRMQVQHGRNRRRNWHRPRLPDGPDVTTMTHASCESRHSRLSRVQVQHARNRKGFHIGDGCLRARLTSRCAMPATACRRAYDHRMRDLVCDERDPGLFRHLGVPRSTAVSWIRRGPRPVVSADVLAMDGAELQAEVLALRRRIRFLLAIVRLASWCPEKDRRNSRTNSRGHGAWQAMPDRAGCPAMLPRAGRLVPEVDRRKRR